MKRVRLVSFLVCFLFAGALLVPCAFASSVPSAIVVCPITGQSQIIGVSQCGMFPTLSAFCSYCSVTHTYSNVIVSHAWQETGRTEPTMTSEGLITYRCSSCGSIKSESIPKLCAHEWIETGRTEPTTTSEGMITYQCSSCGETKSESIPKLEVTPPESCTHEWIETDRTEPTTETPGQITYTCSQCGSIKTQSISVRPVYDGTFMNWLGSVAGLFSMTVNSIMGFPALRLFAGAAVFLTMFSLMAKLIQQGRKGRL